MRAAAGYAWCMSENGKTAIVMTGGAMKSVHGAGFLYALRILLDIPRPNIMVGSSGDAGNTLYYCADQCEEMRRIWVNALTTRDFISFRRFWRIMNVDYLVDQVCKKLEPLDVTRVLSSSTRWYIPITDFDSGTTRYVGAEDRMDPFEVLRAAKALPLFYGRRVRLAHARYLDGELGPTLQDHVDFAVARGAKRILVIRHNSLWSKLSRIYGRLYAATVSSGLRRSLIHDMTMDSVHITEPSAKLIVVVPKRLPLRGSADNAKARVQATFDRGVADALALQDELRALLV